MFLLALRASSFGIVQKYAPPFCILTTVTANKNTEHMMGLAGCHPCFFHGQWVNCGYQSCLDTCNGCVPPQGT